MLDLSLPELAVIAVVALLVLGPDRLPGAARTAGALLRRMQRSWASLRADIERELATDDLRRELKRTGQALEMDRLRDELARTRQEVERDLAGGIPPVTEQSSTGPVDGNDHGRA